MTTSLRIVTLTAVQSGQLRSGLARSPPRCRQIHASVSGHTTTATKSPNEDASLRLFRSPPSASKPQFAQRLPGSSNRSHRPERSANATPELAQISSVEPSVPAARCHQMSTPTTLSAILSYPDSTPLQRNCRRTLALRQAASAAWRAHSLTRNGYRPAMASSVRILMIRPASAASPALVNTSLVRS